MNTNTKYISKSVSKEIKVNISKVKESKKLSKSDKAQWINKFSVLFTSL